MDSASGVSSPQSQGRELATRVCRSFSSSAWAVTQRRTASWHHHTFVREGELLRRKIQGLLLQKRDTEYVQFRKSVDAEQRCQLCHVWERALISLAVGSIRSSLGPSCGLCCLRRRPPAAGGGEWARQATAEELLGSQSTDSKEQRALESWSAAGRLKLIHILRAILKAPQKASEQR